MCWMMQGRLEESLMKYNPHEYQEYAIRYIETHPISAVFLDMGLGKTSITLTALYDLLFDFFKIHKVIVIAPLRVARDTWSAEIMKWEHLRGLRYSVAVGTEAERLAALRRKADIYIINRENVQWLVEESGIPFDFDMVVIDELSSFKNHQSKRFKALMKKRPGVERIVGLTGTPSSNGLMDLWAEFKLLDMGERLGRFIGQYRTRYFLPDKRNGQVVFSYKPLPGAEESIYQAISDITISMKASDHLQMPELIQSRYTVYLSEKEMQRYVDMKQELVLELPDGEITAANAASLSGKLSQMANGAVYADNQTVISIHDRKLDALEDMIESMGGKPLLVAYWFQHDLERITERLYKLKIPFSRLDTAKSIQRWNAGELPVALIHPASAGHGLNLQSGGSTIVWFGLTWSLELYQQTNARLWRQGQRAETVVVQHILTEGTIDGRIMKALSEKDSTQAALIDAVKADLKI
uniref:Chromatin remodeling complex ATPase n=1 Tax=Myoviridae sp. ctOv05 TaxID=2825094 RepID=A0A8S5P524_9CAUD|nr:MAG TPA: Chromatin remodeling complex ATPase [Myoviridae sp. ctOv05]